MTPEEIWQCAANVWAVGARELERLTQTIDRRALAQCVSVLSACKGRIVTMGCGTSGVAARKIAHTLSCVDRSAFFLSPADAPHGALGTIQPGDVAVLVSYGGGTAELVSVLPWLKARGAFLIVVTQGRDSPLARASDLLLLVIVEKEADDFNMLATTSTMTVIAVFDAIAIALSRHTGFTRERFATIHPGGAVGGRLLSGDDA
jgi:KpsF/GutQ family protein